MYSHRDCVSGKLNIIARQLQKVKLRGHVYNRHKLSRSGIVFGDVVSTSEYFEGW
jgi:hypothetical protein